MNADRYIELLKRLKHETLCIKPRKIVRFLHDNARPHTALKTKKTISDLRQELLDHPAYSPDLAPSDYYLFGHLKEYLSGTRYHNNEELKQSVVKWLKNKSKDFYKTGIFKLPKKNGGFFEKKLRPKIFFSVNHFKQNLEKN